MLGWAAVENGEKRERIEGSNYFTLTSSARYQSIFQADSLGFCKPFRVCNLERFVKSSASFSWFTINR